MVKEGLIPLPHSVADEVARLVVSDASPVSGPVRALPQVIERRFVGLAFDEPVAYLLCHRFSYESRIEDAEKEDVEKED
jgi:hypothetical protein